MVSSRPSVGGPCDECLLSVKLCSPDNFVEMTCSTAESSSRVLFCFVNNSKNNNNNAFLKVYVAVWRLNSADFQTHLKRSVNSSRTS